MAQPESPHLGGLASACLAECRQDIASLARLLGLRLDPIHRLMLAGQNRPRHLLLAPRGFGKTTIRTVLTIVRDIVRDPRVRVLLVSRTAAQAQGFLREIVGHLTANPQFRVLAPLARGVPWTRSEICVADRGRTMKEPTVTALGMGGPVISRHYDLIVCDDIVDEQSAASADQRVATLRWFFTTLMPCLEPDGTLHVIGTRYHPNDLYGHLLAGAFADAHTILPALDAEDCSTWPERFPTPLLRRIRAEAGPIVFDAQYQNSTDRMHGAIFRAESFRFGQPPADSPLLVYQGVDLAISTEQRGDWFAIVTIGLAPSGEVYVLDAYRARLSFHEQTAAIAGRAGQWQPERVAIEANAYQAAQLQHVLSTTQVPAFGITTVRDKVLRAWRLSARFERGEIVFTPGVTWLVDELRDFPDGPHDDGFDALDHALAAAGGRTPNMRFL